MYVAFIGAGLIAHVASIWRCSFLLDSEGRRLLEIIYHSGQRRVLRFENDAALAHAHHLLNVAALRKKGVLRIPGRCSIEPCIRSGPAIQILSPVSLPRAFI